MFKSNIETLRKASPARPSKRFACWVVDMILVALLAELLFMAAYPIVQNTQRYKDTESTLAEEIAYYEQLTEKTHIVEYVDGQRVSGDVVALKNLYRAICLSYDVFGSEQQPDFKFGPDHDVRMNGTHSLDSDNVAYFYTRYLKETPEISIEVRDDVFEIYKKAFGNDAAFMFTFNRDICQMPVLNTQVAYYLFHYLFIDPSDSIGQTGATYYEAYRNAYTNMLEEAEMLILQSEPYYSTHYADYKEAYSAQARYTNITLVLSVFVSCLLVLMIPKYLFKDGKTVGYKLLGLGVIGVDGQAVSRYVSLTKAVLASFGAIPIAFILYLFPPFNGSFEAMFVPVSTQSGLSLALVILAITAIGGIANAFCLFTHRRQSLINLIFGDVVVDVHWLDEGEHEETNPGRPY